jgi:hypothetical protein
VFVGSCLDLWRSGSNAARSQAGVVFSLNQGNLCLKFLDAFGRCSKSTFLRPVCLCARMCGSYEVYYWNGENEIYSLKPSCAVEFSWHPRR